jgi:hypothetical protein
MPMLDPPQHSRRILNDRSRAFASVFVGVMEYVKSAWL